MTQFYPDKNDSALTKLNQQFPTLTPHACLWIDAILNAVQDSVIVLNKTYKILMANQVTFDLLGYCEEELLNQHFVNILDKSTNYTSMIEESLQKNIEVTYITKTGQPITVLLSSRSIIYEESETTALICTAKNISQEQRMRALINNSRNALYYDLNHDKLTSLPNRKLFLEELEKSLNKTNINERFCFSILVIDLDQFQLINNSYGHLMGDRLLLEVVERLQKCLHSEDILARLGGDEFGIIINDSGTLDHTLAVVDCLKKGFIVPFKLNDYEVYSSASIGIAFSDKKYQKVEDMLRDADAALNQAKVKDKASYAIFHQQMYLDAVNRIELDNDLRRAIEGNQFELRYQPIVALNSQNIQGFEALIRWKHPEKGFISPANFIPVAEESGLIIPLSDWVFQQAFQQLYKWQQISTKSQEMTMSVNLSTKQFSQVDLVENIKTIVQEIGINFNSLKLEITESSIIKDTEKICLILSELKSLGIQLSMDDFGTGYSSLSYLHRFPLDTLKIDRSFINDITRKADQLNLTQTIINLANNFGMEVIAEGIETLEQVQQLQQLGCPFGQGYYFYRPLTAQQAENLILEDNISAMV